MILVPANVKSPIPKQVYQAVVSNPRTCKVKPPQAGKSSERTGRAVSDHRARQTQFFEQSKFREITYSVVVHASTGQVKGNETRAVGQTLNACVAHRCAGEVQVVKQLVHADLSDTVADERPGEVKADQICQSS